MSNVGSPVSRKPRGLDFSYLVSKGPNWAKCGIIWPNLNFRARDFKFVSNIGFYVPRKPMGLDLGYLASRGLKGAKVWPNVAEFGPCGPIWSLRDKIAKV